MKHIEIPETWLQTWFEAKAKENELCSAITNITELKDRLKRLTVRNKRTEDVQRIGLMHADSICHSLLEAKILSANKSVSLNPLNQMRPDVILYTSGANYILVELKTKATAERQGVQELLAYSAAIKLSYPYVNDFLFIVVASTWDVLLQRSVQALILEGRRVLPLQCSHEVGQGDGSTEVQKDAVLEQLELTIRLDLFDMTFVPRYDPYYAMSTSTLGVAIPYQSRRSVWRYLTEVGHKASYACRRMQQSGFVLGWQEPIYRSENTLLSLVLVTVNQHWIFSEFTPSDFKQNTLDDKPIGIGALVNKTARSMFKKHTQGLDDDDIYGRSRAYCAVEELHPQSSLSYEVLERNRDLDTESHMEKSWRNPAFEQGGDCNLEQMLDRLMRLPLTQINVFLRFGDFADFANKVLPRGAQYTSDVVETLKQYREYKVGADFARPAGPCV